MALILPKKLKITQRVLKNVAKPVDFRFPYQLEQLGMMLHQFMREKQAIGLAAPQVGISVRAFVMDVDGAKLTCFNPKFTMATMDQLFECQEGCVSFPGEWIPTTRPRKILAQYQDVHGTWQEQELEGMASVCFQHELDHLDGITMHERANVPGPNPTAL